MIGIVYSILDEAGTNMAQHMAKDYGFEAVGEKELKYRNSIAKIFEIDVLAFQAETLDSLGCDAIVFLSRHKSEAGIAALTTHSLGNWRNEAAFGGAPKKLSKAAPLLMKLALANLSKVDLDVEKTYEATHHGPLLNTPSLFIELGGDESLIGDKELAAKVAGAAYDSISDFVEGDADQEKVVVGIGGTHYPEKFSRLALTKNYAFSHIMPKYAVLNEDGSSNLDVLEQVLTASKPAPEGAVLDWKSLNSLMKEETLKKLEELGLDHEKV